MGDRICRELRKTFFANTDILEHLDELRERFGVEYFANPANVSAYETAITETQGKGFQRFIDKWTIPRFYANRRLVARRWREILTELYNT